MWQPPTEHPERRSPDALPRALVRHSFRDQGATRRHWVPAALATVAGKVLVGALVTAVVAGFTLVYLSFAVSQSPHGSTGTPLAPGQGSVLPTPTPTEIAPTMTPTVAPPITYLRVTQNQDYRYSCLNRPMNYPVTLRNVGDLTASWSIVFPYVSNPYGGPYWGAVGGKDTSPDTSGTLAVGQSYTMAIWPQYGHQCAGQVYQATIHVTLPNGRSQPDLHITYAGSGPDPYAHVVVNQNQNYSESCVNGTAPPPPYTATLTDTGNDRAFPQVFAVETLGNGDNTPSLAGVIWLTAGQTWIDANQTVNVTMTPQTWIGCKPGTYHLKIVFDLVDWQGDSQVVMLTDTIT